jgi:deoxyinosine 3'endonuclease (endonuclease V)
VERKLKMQQHIVSQYIKFQKGNAKHLIKHDTFRKENIRYIGGFDISCDLKNPDSACAFLSIFDLETNSIVHEEQHCCIIDQPYVSGCLGLREVPQYLTLLDKVKGKPYFPNILMVDGFGILHQRKYGSASELGHIACKPSIGVGKTLLHIDGLEERSVKKEFAERCKNKGDYIPLIGQSGFVYGAALKSSENASNPLYVSIGHAICLETAIEFVVNTSLYRVPEPIRNSDIKSKLVFK